MYKRQVYDELNRFMLGSGMIVPGSTYWNSVSYTHLDVYKRQELHRVDNAVGDTNRIPIFILAESAYFDAYFGCI